MCRNQRGPSWPQRYDGNDFAILLNLCPNRPQQTMRDFVAEAARVVKPGGTLTFVDNNPK